MAFLVLFIWPIVVFVLFNKYRVPQAVLGSLIGGYLLLPHGIGVDLPLLPKLTKDTIPALTAFAALMFFAKPKDQPPGHGILTHSKIGNLLLLGMVISPFATVFANPDTLTFGPRVLPGLRPYDAFSATLTAIMALLPFYLGYRYLPQAKHHVLLLFSLMLAGLLYSLPTLFEVRMSPQLHTWIFGYFQHSFAQHVRADGFRPIVFLQHGLWLSLFLTMATLAAIGYMRIADLSKRTILRVAVVFLFVVVWLSKSVGVLFILAVLAPIALFANMRLQLIAAAIVAGCVLFYPALRSTNILPLEAITNQAYNIDPARAASFQLRLSHEDTLLERAGERSLLGWGGYGRNRLYNSRGDSISITDGHWIIALGVGGWLRYIAEFGLLTMPLILLVWRARRIALGPETSALCLIMACNLVDLIPNAGITPLTWLISGALWGRLSYAHATVNTELAETANPRQAKYQSLSAPPVITEPVKKPQVSRVSLYTRQKTQKFRQS